VAAFGAVMVGRLDTELAEAAAAARAQGAADAEAGVESGASELSVGLADAAEAAQGSPELVHALPEPVRDVVVTAFDHAMQGVFTAGVPIAVLGLVAVAFMRGVPLRGGRAKAPKPARKARRART
ncbi:MFS transporter, partial [Nocardiopsis tropica]|nr:MFS transporter [Nocardiopsis tropica]